jgi:hypothetical protein
MRVCVSQRVDEVLATEEGLRHTEAHGITYPSEKRF